MIVKNIGQEKYSADISNAYIQANRHRGKLIVHPKKKNVKELLRVLRKTISTYIDIL